MRIVTDSKPTAGVRCGHQMCVGLVAGLCILLLTEGSFADDNRQYDLDRSGEIDGVDLELLMSKWGPCAAPCKADFNGDGHVDAADVAALTSRIGVQIAVDPAEPKVVHETMPEQFPLDPDPAPQVELVSRDLKQGFVAGRNLIDLGEVPQERIIEANWLHEEKYAGIHPGPYRIGFTRQLDPPVSLPLAAPREDLGGGEFLWRFAIRSPGSFETRLHIENFDIGRSEMIFFAPRADGVVEAHGPYGRRGPENDGDFWPPSVLGDTVYVEIRGPDAPRFDVFEIVHNDRDRIAPEMDVQENPLAGDECVPASQVFPCHLDVMCESVNVFAREATGQMSFVSGGINSVCTGTILNDLDNATYVPYFLTAFHCLNTQSEVDTLMVTWFFQNTSCNSGVIDTTQTSTGGTLLVTNPTDPGNDMTFIRLNSVPAGVTAAGWTTASLSSGHGIHHPAGTFKRATWFTSGSGLCVDPNDYDYYEVTDGAIQGGSSGSGIFNSSGQLSGQLLGTCGINCDPNELACPFQQDYDRMYGEFESTWEDTNVSYWLTLGGTIWVDHNNSSSPWNGTSSDPYPTVGQGHGQCWNGSRMAIRTGSYNEQLTLSKRITIVAANGPVTIGQ